MEGHAHPREMVTRERVTSETPKTASPGQRGWFSTLGRVHKQFQVCEAINSDIGHDFFFFHLIEKCFSSLGSEEFGPFNVSAHVCLKKKDNKRFTFN